MKQVQKPTTRLLVTGEMRSGTTFVANFLNSQQGCCVFADTLVTLFMEAHVLKITDIHIPLTDRQKNVLLSNLLNEGRNRALDFSSIDRSRPLDWWTLFCESLDIIKGETTEGSVVGIKRTREEKYLPALLKSGVKVVYCCRDPRDVLVSAKNRFSEFNSFEFLNNWKQSVAMASSLRGDPNFYFLKYEELILEKEKTAESLGTFLGIPVTANLQSLQSPRDEEYQDNSSFGDVKKLFDPKAVHRWKGKPAEEETDLAEAVCQSELKQLGYPSNADANLRRGKTLAGEFEAYFRKKRRKAQLRGLVARWLD